MGTKSNACLRFLAALTLGLPLLCASAQTQAARKPLPAYTQVGPQILNTPILPRTNQRTQAATRHQPMTPFERVIAPQMKLSMQKAATRTGSTNSQAKPNTHAHSSGTGGSNVNFPGFVSAPFVTIADDPLSASFNSVSGDFNNDGKMDVATIKIDGTISVILNPGTFANIATLSPITSNNNGNPGFLYISYVAVADMNGDGFPDLVGQDLENNAVVIWLGKGDGTFGPPSSYPFTLTGGASWTQGYGGSIVVGDFNGDGSIDVATVILVSNYVASASTTTVAEVTLVNDGTGHLVSQPEEDSTLSNFYVTEYGNSAVTYSAPGTPSGFVLMAVNEAVNPPYDGGGVSLIALTSNGDGTFAPAVDPVGPLAQDYTLSVDDSVVATNLTSTTGSAVTTDIVFQTGDGAIYDAPFTSGNPATASIIAGVNYQLFAFGGPYVPPVTMAPTPASLTSSSLNNQLTLNVADMNGDGLQDVILYSENGITIFPNAGAGVFTAAPIEMLAGTPGVQQPQPAPYDGSKYNSLLSVDYALNQVGYYQNLGATASVQAGQFTAAALATGANTDTNYVEFGTNIQVVATPDIDGDGIPEIIGLDIGNINSGATNVVVGFRNGALSGNESSNYTFKTALLGQTLNDISNGLDYVEPVTIQNALGTSVIVVVDGQGEGPYLITAGKDGVFGAPTQLPMGATPPACPVNFADVGDINGDGIQDIVFAYGGASVCGSADVPSGYYTLLGNADGTFQPATFTPLGTALYMVRLINFTGAPGVMDLVALDQHFGAAYGAILLPGKGDGTGAFDASRITTMFPGYIFSDIVAGDFNSDGKQDLTLLTEGQYDPAISDLIPNTSGVLLLAGHGDYTFGTPTLVAPGMFPQWGTYADFNGDGNPDLALAELYQTLIYENNDVPAVQILPNLGGGVFGNAITEFSSFTPDYNKEYFSTLYTFAGSFTNSGGPDLLMGTSFGSPTFVNRGVTALALTASSATPSQGAAETFTATISQVVSAGADETGSVVFSAGGTTLGTAQVSGGVATLTTTSLAVGADVVTATYAGDANHNTAAATITVTVAALTPNFTLTATAPTLYLTQGASGSVLLAVTGNSTFSGSVALTCTGAPAESTCTASPTAVTLATGQATGITVVVSTTPPNNSYTATGRQNNFPLTGELGATTFAGLVLMMWPGRRRLPRLVTLLAIAAIALGSAATLTGCSGSGSGSKTNLYPGTAAGSYTLTVTGVSGSITQTQTIALTVTAAQ